MAAVISFLDDRNISHVLTTRDSWFDYYQANLAPPAAHPAGSSAAVASRLLPSTAFQENRTQFTKVLSYLYQYKVDEQNVTIWIMLVTPTRFAHTTTSALHPTWSNATWSIRIHKLWDQYYNSAPDANRRYFKLVNQALQPLRNLTPGMGVSINEADIWEPEHADGFWGATNHARLSEIKLEVDPTNVLTNWMAVGWEEGAERFKCYPTP